MTGIALTASKTPAIIVAEILMMSASFKGVHFLVEGNDDSKFWKRHILSDSVTIVNCEGKPNLVGACDVVETRGLSTVVGVYDPDFERLLGITFHPNILTPTDQNDLELTLIASDALSILLLEYADPSQIADFEKSQNLTLVKHLEATSRGFGQLRYLSGKLGHQVDFERLSPYRFVSVDTWLLDKGALITEYATLCGLSVFEVDLLVQLHCPPSSNWSLSQGHDTVKVLAQGLRRRIGRNQMDEKVVAKVLRIAFSRESLRQSNMYKFLFEFAGRLSAPIFN